MQCGADSLTGDKLGGFNLTLASYGYCMKKILSWKKPTLVLGGGCNILSIKLVDISKFRGRNEMFLIYRRL